MSLALLLEDNHTITAKAVHEAASFLIQHMPPQLHLVLSSRTDPPLPLARLRARGQLTEIRSENLCFNHEETTSVCITAHGQLRAPASRGFCNPVPPVKSTPLYAFWSLVDALAYG
jgi:LuxR family maltose regulon positive regulatory protein